MNNFYINFFNNFKNINRQFYLSNVIKKNFLNLIKFKLNKIKK